MSKRAISIICHFYLPVNSRYFQEMSKWNKGGGSVMKKILFKTLPILAALVITSCGAKNRPSSSNPSIEPSNAPSSTSEPSSSVHEHTYEADWSFDEQYHWHEATCGHHEAETKEAHVFTETIIRESALRKKECSICHFVDYETIAVYDVQWMNEGVLLDKEMYLDGDVPSYKGETPTKGRDSDYNTYEFMGWDKTPAPIHENTTFNAQFRMIQHVHTLGNKERVDISNPTCTAPGSYQMVSYCAECGKAYNTETFEIPELGHDLVQVTAKAATCTEDGWNAYEYCRRCDYTTKVDIPATGHIHTKTKTENEVPATCTESGSYDLVTYCEDDDVELSRETIAIPALGHHLVHVDAQAASCTQAGWEAYDYCDREGCDYTTKVEIAALGHNPVYNNETLENKCSRCGEVVTRNYEMTLGLEPLHVGDLYNEFAATVSWKNDDHRLDFVYVMYEFDGRLVVSSQSGKYVIPDSDLGKNVIAHVYVGVYDDTYAVIDGELLTNCTIICNDVSYSCNGHAGGRKTIPSGRVYDSYYHYAIPLGTVLADPNEYTVTWKNYDGTVLETDTVHRGETPTYDGETPTKPSDGPHKYTFNNWDKQVVANTGEDVVYTATFTESPNTFMVSWVIEGITTQEEYEYGQTPSYKGATPTKEATAQYTYTFNGWDNELVAVTSNQTYTALFNESIRVYNIVFDCHGTPVVVPTNYGEVPVAPEVDGYTDGDDYYVFDGWDSDLVEVTGDKTYTAQYIKNVFTFELNEAEDGYVVTGLIEPKSKQNIVIPSKWMGLPVKEIGEDAFLTDNVVKTVTLPASLEVINESAFQQCIQLQSVTFNEGLKVIKRYAFHYDDSLQNLVFPSTLEYIGSYTFCNVDHIEKLYIPLSVTEIEANAFYDAYIETIYCAAASQPEEWSQFWNRNCGATVYWNTDENSQVITQNDFEYLINRSGEAVILSYSGTAENLTIPDVLTIDEVSYPITEIGYRAFYENATIKNLVIGNNVRVVGDSALSWMEELTTITIPDNVEELGNSALAYSRKLEVINGTFGLKKLGSYAYAGLTLLEYVYLPASIIELNGFQDVDMFTVPTLCEPASKPASWSNAPVVAIYGVDRNPNVQTINGISYLLKEDGTAILLSIKNQTMTNIVIPDAVTYDEQSYQVTSYFTYFLRGNETVTSLTLNSVVTSIPRWIVMDTTNLATIILPEGVTSLSEYVFNYASGLHDLYLPSTFVYIGYGVFDNVESASVVIHYNGTMEEWADVSISTYANFEAVVTQVICTDGTITIGE